MILCPKHIIIYEYKVKGPDLCGIKTISPARSHIAEHVLMLTLWYEKALLMRPKEIMPKDRYFYNSLLPVLILKRPIF